MCGSDTFQHLDGCAHFVAVLLDHGFDNLLLKPQLAQVLRREWQPQGTFRKSKHLAKVSLSNDIFKLYVLPLKDWIGEGLWRGLWPSCQGQSS